MIEDFESAGWLCRCLRLRDLVADLGHWPAGMPAVDRSRLTEGVERVVVHLQLEEYPVLRVVRIGYLTALRSLPYGSYLRTLDWRLTREFAFERADWHCTVCGAPWPLQAHHRTYLGLGFESLVDVAALCRLCHRRFHDREHARAAESIEWALARCEWDAYVRENAHPDLAALADGFLGEFKRKSRGPDVLAAVKGSTDEGSLE